jgi:hypothetical protein
MRAEKFAIATMAAFSLLTSNERVGVVLDLTQRVPLYPSWQ